MVNKDDIVDALVPLLPDNRIAVIASNALNDASEEEAKEIIAMCRDFSFAVLLTLPHKVVQVGHPSEVK